MLASQSTVRRLRLRSANFRQRALDVLGAENDYDIAVALDIHPSTLSKLVNGKSQPSEAVIVKTIDGLRGPFEDFFAIVDEAA